MKATTDFRFFRRGILGNLISIAIVAVFLLSLTVTAAQANIIYSPTGIVDHSTEYNPSYPPSKLIDSVANTFAAIKDDTANDDPNYVTGHVLFDLGENLEIGRVLFTARSNGMEGKAYNPSSVDFYYFGDNNPYDNTGVLDDIEGDSDIISLGTYSLAELYNGDSCEILLTTSVTTQYIGMRVLDSYETAGNFQLDDVSFAGPAANVPEPSTLVLLFGMALSLLLFRRK